MTTTHQLEVLAGRETDCMAALKRNGGARDDYDPEIEAQRYDEYQTIHAAYTELLGEDPNQEALKRALFIQWYSMADPSFSSGIGLLLPEAELHVLTRLNHLLQNGAADAELTEMLTYYADANWNYGFTLSGFHHLTALQTFIQLHENDKRNSYAPAFNLHEMKKRGQMGEYWLHILCGLTR